MYHLEHFILSDSGPVLPVWYRTLKKSFFLKYISICSKGNQLYNYCNKINIKQVTTESKIKLRHCETLSFHLNIKFISLIHIQITTKTDNLCNGPHGYLTNCCHCNKKSDKMCPRNPTMACIVAALHDHIFIERQCY